MKQKFTLLCFLFFSLGLSAQGLPRLFLDLPHIYLTAPDVENVNHLLGMGVGSLLNVGTHWGVARVGGGADFVVDPKSNDIGETFEINPYAKFEAGVGIYRSNGNRCAKTNRAAFTAMGKTGFRYNFNGKDVILANEDKSGIDYSVGAEFGYFYIRDMFKNYEFSMSADYFTQSKTIAVTAGFKLFLNLRANR